MYNITHAVKGTKLVIEVDLSPKTLAAATPSRSGATMLVASTGGFQAATVVANKAVKFAVNVTVAR
jgi:hypothetical protein